MFEVVNEDGCIYLIPDKYKIEVEDMIKCKCFNCLSSLINDVGKKKE